MHIIITSNGKSKDILNGYLCTIKGLTQTSSPTLTDNHSKIKTLLLIKGLIWHHKCIYSYLHQSLCTSPLKQNINLMQRAVCCCRGQNLENKIIFFKVFYNTGEIPVGVQWSLWVPSSEGYSMILWINPSVTCFNSSGMDFQSFSVEVNSQWPYCAAKCLLRTVLFDQSVSYS